MARRLSDEDDEFLVEEISKHPSLWQLSYPKYKDQRVKDNVWAEIAGKVGKSSEFNSCLCFTKGFFSHCVNTLWLHNVK